MGALAGGSEKGWQLGDRGQREFVTDVGRRDVDDVGRARLQQR
jgi:hypothetical protein